MGQQDQKVRELIFTAMDNAFAYSNFADPEFRKLVRKLISAMENDLDEVNWSPSSIAERLAQKIEDYINTLNEEDKPEVTPVVIVREEDDEDTKPVIVEKINDDRDDLPSTT